MKVCKDCIHIDACASWKNSEIDSCSLAETLRVIKQSEACNLFEPKITRCNECKHFHQDIGGGENVEDLVKAALEGEEQMLGGIEND